MIDASRLATRRARRGMVSTVDHLATAAGVHLLSCGGSAADAAVGASAVLAVTTQHMCGMGGDLWALVHHGTGAPGALVSAGRAGSGADADRLRREGHAVMPFSGDVRSVPVPGCVDGWLALHERHGRLPLADVLEPAIEQASAGFPAAPLLASMAPRVQHVDGAEDFRTRGPLRSGDLVRRPGVARALRSIVADGRTGFYGGAFGEGLLALGAGEFVRDDLSDPQAAWVPPLAADVWGHRVFTTPPPSQGYLTLLGCLLVERLGPPDDPEDPAWAHLLVEAARLAGHDRGDLLHEAADADTLLDPERITRLARRFDPRARVSMTDRSGRGDTIHLCVVDADRMAVSLIQSNASGFGAGLTVPGTGIFLHNRGIGFSLEPGHPAEYGPGRRPPSTLSPALVTRRDGSARAVLGTMGGDAQPQVLLQLLTRLLVHGTTAGPTVGAPRWTLADPDGGGFDTWRRPAGTEVRIEADAPEAWAPGLAALGHPVRVIPPLDSSCGHAHVIEVGEVLAGAADPRARTGAAAGH